MLAKIAAVAQSKAALAVLGIVLVGGGGGAVAVAATTGHLSTLGVNLNSEKSANAQASETPDSHAGTHGYEGLLVSCTGTTILVKDSSGKSWTFNVSATTKFNGDTETESHAAGGSSTDGAGASSAKGDNSTPAGDNSVHTATTLAQVCALAGTRDVQVQATSNGSTYDAWKVTVQGPGSINGGSSDNGASTEGASTEGGASTKGDTTEGGDSSMGGASTKGTDSGTPTTNH